MANRYGTMSRVVGVPNRSPPITARASAAFCSSPGPPIAIGNMPTIIAAAVISTGRMRVCPALPPDGFTTAHRGLIISLAEQAHVPFVAAVASLAREGGLLSYGPDS